MPAGYALKGYTYQQYIYMLLTAIMDAKREITMIDAETFTDGEKHNFDDICIEVRGQKYVFQTKNYPQTKYEDIKIDSERITINSNTSVFSKDKINIFVINTEHFETTSDEILGLPAQKIGEVFLVALPHDKVQSIIENLYQDEKRISAIMDFAYKRIIEYKFKTTPQELPPLIRFSTELEEKTILLRNAPEDINVGVLCIVGKPGVGKSHYVQEIINKYPDSIIYRFWVGSQDANKNYRLNFSEFLKDIALDIFQSPRSFTRDELIEAIKKSGRIMIIDGLDHVENYNKRELDDYFNFISDLNESRVLILTRPLSHVIPWTTVELNNWNYDETAAYLEVAHDIKDYLISNQIYKITDGYPIITYFIAEHYKKTGEITFTEKINGVFDYYDELLKDVNVKNAISIFRINNSFILEEEIDSLCNNAMLSNIISDFIKDYPYLFRKIANRISLIHDSLNTYLRSKVPKESIAFAQKIVEESILNLEIRYLSRFESFTFDTQFVEQVIKLYCSLDTYERIATSNFDYASIQEFYLQLRRTIEFYPNILSVYQYYSLILIYLLVARNNMIQEDDFIYQIINYGNINGIDEKQIFSQGYLWNSYLLINYGIQYQFSRYLSDLHYASNVERALQAYEKELNFFDVLKTEWNREAAWKEFDNRSPDFEYDKAQILVDYMVGLYLNECKEDPLYKLLIDYVDNNDDWCCKEEMNLFCSSQNIRPPFSSTILSKVQYKLWELGVLEKNNIFFNTSIQALIKKRASNGSFDVRETLLSYIRLQNYYKAPTDIQSLSLYWNMYYNHKDYSIHDVQITLGILEKKGLISEKDSIDMIISVMDQSDKGIRDLLLRYIESKKPTIIERLYACYSLNRDFPINYFDLNPNYINCLRPETIYEAITDHIRYGIRMRTTDYHDIKNVLQSNYKNEMLGALNTFSFGVYNVPRCKARMFKRGMCELEPKTEKTKETTFLERGYLVETDLEFIRKNKVSPIEISYYTDGWYSCFPYVELYQSFDKAVIKEQHLDIIHTALYAKTHSLKSTGNWYKCADTMLALLDWCEVDLDWVEIFKIFRKFIDLSFITFLQA